MWALSIATLPIPNVGNVGITACHPRGFDVGYRRLNRYILTNYVFLENGGWAIIKWSHDSRGIFHVGATGESAIEPHGFWPCHQFTPR